LAKVIHHYLCELRFHIKSTVTDTTWRVEDSCNRKKPPIKDINEIPSPHEKLCTEHDRKPTLSYTIILKSREEFIKQITNCENWRGIDNRK
jgi:hypothetical protein